MFVYKGNRSKIVSAFISMNSESKLSMKLVDVDSKEKRIEPKQVYHSLFWKKKDMQIPKVSKITTHTLVQKKILQNVFEPEHNQIKTEISRKEKSKRRQC